MKIDNGTKILECWLTHWGRATHICVSKLTIIGSDNGLSPGRRQAIICTNAGILLIRTLGTKVSEILSEIHAFSFKKKHLKTSSAKRRPFCLGLNVLTHWGLVTHMRPWSLSTLVQVMACHLFGTKPFHEPMMTSCQLDHQKQTSVKFYQKTIFFSLQNCI